MALSRVKTWISGEVLTASDLNSEFNNILNNPVSLISPLTGAIDFDGYAVTLDALAATQVVSSAAVSWNFTSGAKTGAPATTGSIANWSAQTFTDSNTAASGTAAAWTGFSIQRPTLAATNASVTTTAAATLYIPNAPLAGTNQTITNSYALWVDDGVVRIDGNLTLNGSITSDIVINGIEAGRGAGNVALNSVFGDTALDSNTTGDQCCAFGYATLTENTTAIGNAGFGYRVFDQTTTGSYNTGIGWSAGSIITTGSNNSFLGRSSQPSSATVSNEITLGNSSITTLRCQVTTITALSDERDKKDIIDLPLGLDFIKALRPVKFTWHRRDGTKEGLQEAGFIAQELDVVQKDFSAEEYLNLVLKENPDKLEASPGKILPILVKAIQELKSEFDEYKSTHP